MFVYNQNSQTVIVFHDFPVLKKGMTLAGYAALIVKYRLAVPTPDTLCAIGTQHKEYEQTRWQIFTTRYQPADNLYGHLVFALKHEGVDLAALKALFDIIEPQAIVDIVHSTPTGAYSRKIWFLYEWLCDKTLAIADIKQGNFVPLLNDALQYPGSNRDSKRHRVRNNLPGTREFCPIIRRTEKLDHFIAMDLTQTALDRIGATHTDLLSRAAAFLLIKDSKASYTIEGETPPHNRIERWGKMISEAGQREFSIAELEYLQTIVITDPRFTTLGCRAAGGFVGDHDRMTGMPLPAHISARAADLASLLTGLIATYQLLSDSDYNAVLLAAIIAFGFVFIHPFEDGNGRIHRYLIHHVLADKHFVPPGLIFPVSAVMLDHLDDYRQTLEHYSKPRLDLIKWRPTEKNNVEVLNETIDLYRYFDATRQAEFLFTCVAETVNKTLPEEVNYLVKYDKLHHFINNYIAMPDKTIDLLIRFLNQHGGKLSKRARNKEFQRLSEDEIQAIENKYDEIFCNDR